jgi:diketogulonate reductase-like aldo/keto reductase
MMLIAHTPLARGRVFRDPTLESIGRAHGKDAGQVALRWLVQQPHVVAIPRSANLQHISRNSEICDFDLSPEEMREISGLARTDGRIVDWSGFAPAWD